MFFTYVQADKRQEFERFLDFFTGAIDRIGAEDPEFARQASSFRALYPGAANEDGTLTYVLMGDPLREGTETGIDAILSRLYTEEEIAEHRKPWDEALARDQDARRLVQGKNMNQGPGAKAAPGEEVVMFLTHVRADKRQEFEEFLDFVSETLARLSAEDEKFARESGTFRALFPSEPNEDGTLTYVLMADPLIEGTETGLAPVLSRVYSEEEVSQHMERWSSALARPQDSYRFLQSEHTD